MAQVRPVDGYGGSLYHQSFTVPTYNIGMLDGQPQTTSYWELDYAWHYNQRLLSGFGVCFGLLFMALLNLCALTPASKRGLPLYTFNILAIVCEMTRLLLEIIRYSYTGYSSAYFMLTDDITGSNMSKNSIAVGILIQVFSPFGFMFIQFCFFIQARAVLSAFRTTNKVWHHVIIGTLIGLGVVSFFWRIFESVVVAMDYTLLITWDPDWVWLVADALYTVSIGGWSMIFTIQVGLILYRRAKLGGAIQRTEALNILFLTGIESMVLPS